jgi:hypothetical protein
MKLAEAVDPVAALLQIKAVEVVVVTLALKTPELVVGQVVLA